MKKIWLMNHYATEMYRNKAGRHFWFADKLLENGYKSTVFCANTYHKNNDIINTGRDKYKIESVDNIPFVFVKTTPFEGNGLDRIKNMAWFFKNLFPVTKEIASKYGKPDVIVA